MRILITGATGYVGSRVAAALAATSGFSVIALTRPSSDLTNLRPVLDRITVETTDGGYASLDAALHRSKPEAVIHLASFAPPGPQREQAGNVVSSNVSFGAALLEAMVQAGVSRFINTGTFWEEMDGDGTYRPVDLYAASKRAFQSLLRFYEDAHGMKAITLRLFGVYGPGDTRPKIFSLLKKALSSGETLSLSPGAQELDLVYVDDVVDAYVKAVAYVSAKAGAASEVFEIGSGVSHSLRDVVRVYEECAGTSLNVRWGGVAYRPREVMRGRADLRLAKERLTWKPIHNLKSGIERLLKAEAAMPAST